MLILDYDVKESKEKKIKANISFSDSDFKLFQKLKFITLYLKKKPVNFWFELKIKNISFIIFEFSS